MKLSWTLLQRLSNWYSDVIQDRGHLRKRNLKYVKAESRQVANGTR